MSHRDPIAKHRRDVWLYIWLPIAASVLVIIGVAAFLGYLTLTDNFTLAQLRTTSSVLLMICVFIPLVLVVAIFDFVFIMLAVGTAQLPKWTAALIRPIRGLTQQLAGGSEPLVKFVSEPIIFIEKTLTRWTTFLTGLLNWFDESDTSHESREQSDNG